MRVLLSGYYGFDNAGDEAVLLAILQALREKGFTDITVLSANPAETEKVFQVKAVNRWGKKDILKAVNNCDVLISGGGSLLQDVTSKNGILYYLGIIRLAEMMKKKVMIYAQGIGPITAPRNRSLTKKILNKVNVITVRDFDSFQELTKMGVYRDIYVSADPVLGLSENQIDAELGKNILLKEKNYNSEAKTVVVSVRNWAGKESFLPEIAKACDELATEGWQTVLLPFHYPEDCQIGEELVALMKQPAVNLKGNYSPIETMAILKNADLVVGMRLHSLIMSFVLGKAMVGISYDPKVDSFLQMIRQNRMLCVENLQAEAFLKSIRQALADEDGYRKIWQQMRPIMERQAKEPVELLAKM